jgi:hypothetical protein
MMSNFPARTEIIKPPRWVHVHFPRGAMFGEPGNSAKQRQVLEKTLEAFRTVTSPGGKIEITHRWEGSPIIWRGREITEGP